MQAVRCDACGKKALVAASQCPHCGHLLDLRDIMGELLPMAHCSECDSDYPEREGMCRWCGTKPGSARLAPRALKAAGVVAFVGLGVGAWFARGEGAAFGEADDLRPAAATLVNVPATLVTVPAMERLQDAGPSAVPSDSARPENAAALARPESARVAQSSSAAASATPPPVALLAERAPGAAEPAAPSAGSVRREPARSRPVKFARSPASSAWTTGTADAWATVRSHPHRGARILGSIGPGTRVQTGEARDGWVRIRVKGLSGWTERSRIARRQTGSKARRGQ